MSRYVKICQDMSSDVACRASRAPSVVVGSVYRNMAAQLASAAGPTSASSQSEYVRMTMKRST